MKNGQDRLVGALMGGGGAAGPMVRSLGPTCLKPGGLGIGIVLMEGTSLLRRQATAWKCDLCHGPQGSSLVAAPRSCQARTQGVNGMGAVGVTSSPSVGAGGWKAGPRPSTLEGGVDWAALAKALTKAGVPD